MNWIKNSVQLFSSALPQKNEATSQGETTAPLSSASSMSNQQKDFDAESWLCLSDVGYSASEAGDTVKDSTPATPISSVGSYCKADLDDAVSVMYPNKRRMTKQQRKKFRTGMTMEQILEEQHQKIIMDSICEEEEETERMVTKESLAPASNSIEISQTFEGGNLDDAEEYYMYKSFRASNWSKRHKMTRNFKQVANMTDTVLMRIHKSLHDRKKCTCPPENHKDPKYRPCCENVLIDRSAKRAKLGALCKARLVHFGPQPRA